MTIAKKVGKIVWLVQVPPPHEATHQTVRFAASTVWDFAGAWSDATLQQQFKFSRGPFFAATQSSIPSGTATAATLDGQSVRKRKAIRPRLVGHPR